jgi:hypothetical protein
MTDSTPTPIAWLRSFGPSVLFVLALGLITMTAWWPIGQDLSGTYTGAGIGAALVGLIINPHDERDTVRRRAWYVLILLAAAVSVVSVVALAVHADDTTAARNAAAALVAAFGALAGIVIDVSKLPPVVALLGTRAVAPAPRDDTTGRALETATRRP